MSVVLFRRPPRRPGPDMPTGELRLQEPPGLPDEQNAMSNMLMYAPMALSSLAMVLIFVRPGSGGGALTYIAVGLMAVSAVGMLVTQLIRSSGDRKRQLRNERRDYLRYLTQTRRRVRKVVAQQQQALAWRHPDPVALRSVVRSPRLWERRATHPDFGEIRVAVGEQRLGLALASLSTRPVEDLEPLCAHALRRFIRAYGTVSDQPIAVYLRAYARVLIDGDTGAARAMVRAMLAQLAALHAPEELRIVVVAGPARRAAWEWVKWLPHATHPVDTDAAGPVRLVTDSLGSLEHLLGEEFAGRGPFEPDAQPSRDEPYVVIVVDDGTPAPAGHRLSGSGYRNTTAVDIDGALAFKPSRISLLLRIVDGELEMVNADPTGRETVAPVGRPDALGVNGAAALAGLIAPYRLSLSTDGTEPLSATFELTALLGITDLHTAALERLWAERAGTPGRLRVPLGLSADGAPIELDLKESAQGGMGPHGMLIGATGSGKSELLRTLVLALALTHSSETLNFVLVDFKGGATFLGLDELPHTSAVITNLADEVALVGRMQDALQGELVRRQELLRRAGNYTSALDYERARAAGTPLDPLPTLVVVVDEFSELLAAHREFMDLFVMIGRLGRSLGVHLLLASQRLDEGRTHQLESHLSYRIGLRTFSAMESRGVLGVPDAYQLPSEPGNGFLKSDTATLTRFKAAYVSGPYRPERRRLRRTVAAGQIVAYTSGYLVPRPAPLPAVEPAASAAATPGPATGADPATTPGPATGLATTPGPATGLATTPGPATGLATTPGPATGLATGLATTPGPATGAGLATTPDPAVADAPSLLKVAVDRLRDAGPPAHQVWLPPLDTPPTLDELLPPLVPDPDRGLTAPGWVAEHGLAVPVGVVDLPFQQQRDLLMADLSGSGGHAAVVGGPQSGKSTLLRTLITGLALTQTPREVQFYCLDFGGGTLSGLTGLPHVGSVTGRLDTERISRTIAEVTNLIARRERLFAEHGIDSVTAFRSRRAAGELAGEAYGDVFLVVDGWNTVRQDFPDLVPTISLIATRGLSYGVHVVISATRWGEISNALRDQLVTRFELRLGDPVDSHINMRIAATVPKVPGRGLTENQQHFLAGLPRIDGVAATADLAAGVAALTRGVAELWSGPAAPPVRMLPATITAAELPAPDGDLRVAIGIEDQELAPFQHNFEDSPHLLVVGDVESGKTNLLHLIAQAVVQRFTPAEARIMLVDYRRGLLDRVPEEHRIGYAVSLDAVRQIVDGAARAMRDRLPGPDISPARLRLRDWWKGPRLYLIIDDYDLVASSPMSNPLGALLDFLAQGTELGLHLVVARSANGIARGVADPLLRRLQEVNAPTLLLSCPPSEGRVFNDVRPRQLPPGRGLYLTRRQTVQVQTAQALEEPASRPDPSTART